MLKRKFGDRHGWNRITKKRYAQTYINDDRFKGYITLLQMDEVACPLNMHYGNHNVCIVDHGYCWLQHFPVNEHYSVTTVFDSEGVVVQWYIDICMENGVDEYERPYMDDLFLDIIVLPNGEVILKDEDELESAQKDRIIDQSLYDLAKREGDRIHQKLKLDDFEILCQTAIHKELLQQQMKEIE